jgi:hypothetical protein
MHSLNFFLHFLSKNYTHRFATDITMRRTRICPLLDLFKRMHYTKKKFQIKVLDNNEVSIFGIKAHISRLYPNRNIGMYGS